MPMCPMGMGMSALVLVVRGCVHRLEMQLLLLQTISNHVETEIV